MIWLDRAFAIVLLIGAAGHTFGTFALLPAGSELQVWSLAGVLYSVLVGVLNLMRVARPDDRTLGIIAGLAAFGWLGISLYYGAAIGNFLDFRVIWHAVCAFALAVFSFIGVSSHRPSPSN